MESEQFSLSLPPLPGHHRANSPVQVFSGLSCTQPGGTGRHFLRVGGYLIYRGLQITRRSICLLRPILSSWRFWRATEKLSLDWPDEPRESQSSKLDERFFSGSG